MKASYGVLALAAALLPASAAVSQDTASCDRACLHAIDEQYLKAMVAHDPSKAPFASNIKFTEMGARLKLPDGLWRTATAIGPYRLFVDEPERGGTFFFATALENGAPVILGARLKVVDHKITEAETEVTRIAPPPGATRDTPPAGFAGLPDTLKGTTRHQFTDVVPAAQRLTREQLIDAANRYWDVLELNDGKMPDPFAPTCQRLEGGHPTTNLPMRQGQTKPTGANMSCGDAFGKGFYYEDDRVRDRRFLVVDREHNTVFQQVFMDHSASVRSWKLKDGGTMTGSHTGPWDWMVMAVIQVTPEGKIDQIEATPNAVPYGMRGGWANGDTRPSKAVWDRKMSSD